jgi:ribosomal 50S subunit-associated protein YjgA (DUF615 family)
VFGPASQRRAQLRALVPAPAGEPPPGAATASGSPRAGRVPWAEMLRRVFATDVLSCPCKLGLDEDLRVAVDRARAVTAHVARRRAERTLAGDLRRIDLVALAARLAQVQTTGAAEPQQFHLAEQWRARMLEEGLAAAAEFPGGVTEPLPQLIAWAQRERLTGKPPGAARALFRHIAAVLKAQPATPVTSG